MGPNCGFGELFQDIRQRWGDLDLLSAVHRFFGWQGHYATAGSCGLLGFRVIELFCLYTGITIELVFLSQVKIIITTKAPNV